MRTSKFRCALGFLSLFLAGGVGAANSIAFNVAPGETNVPPQVMVREGEGVLKLRLRREGDLGQACGVSFEVVAGTAQPGTDYSTVGARVAFGAGEQELEFGVSLFADSVKEGDETFSVVLYAPDAGWTLGEPSEVQVTLRDALEGPSLVSPSMEVWEDAGAVLLAVWRGPEITGAVSVEYETRDLTAVSGRDYVATNGVLELGEGEDFGWIEVGLVDGAVVEGTRTFEVVLGRASSGVVPSAFGRTEVTVADDERGFCIPVGGFSVREDDNSVWIPVIRQGGLSQSDKVGFEVSGEGASAGEDYVASNGVLVFGPGETEKWIGVSIVNDAWAEGGEAFRLKLMQVEGGGVVGAPAELLVEIQDNDVGLRFDYSYRSVEEGEGKLVAVVLRGDDGAGEVSVHYRTEDIEAEAGKDYEATSGTLVFAAGEVSKEIVVPILSDELTEGEERFRMVLEEAVGGSLDWPAELVVTVAGETSAVFLQNSYPYVVETDAEAVLVVWRGDDGAEPVEVAYATVDGTAVAGSDYVATNGVLRLEGRGSQATLRVRLVNDVLQEFNQGFRVMLTPVSGPLPADWAVEANVALIDNDTGITVSGGWADEGSGTLEFVVQCQRDVAGPVTVDYATVPGTATAGLDYESASGTLDLVPGGTVNVQVRILGDSTREDYETVLLQLSNPTGGVSLVGETAAGTIWDNDPGVMFESVGAYRNEGDGSVVLRVFRYDDSLETYRVRCRTQDGTALAGADYEPLDVELELPPGGGAQEIVVRLLNDQARENYESFNVMLESATGEAVPGLPATASVTIGDDDDGVQFEWPETSCEEAFGEVTLSVTRWSDASAEVSVEYQTENATAMGGLDYVATNGVLTFAEGERRRHIVLRVLNDEESEGRESFRVRLFNPAGGVELGDQPMITVWIPANGTPTASKVWWVASGWAAEADGWVKLGLERSGDLSRAATVDYRTEDVEAIAGQDYEHASGTVVFEPGQRLASVRVRLKEDSIREAAEAFRVVLLNTRGGLTLEGSGEVLVGIEDDDRGIWWEGPDYWVLEENGIAEAVVRYQSDAVGPTEVRYATVDGTAVAGEDYVATNGVWVLGAGGGILRVRVPILNDGLREESETFGVKLWVQGGGMQVDGQAQASVSIEDNDPGVLWDYGVIQVNEGSGRARLRVRVQTDATGEFTVNYETLSGAAVAGEDFVATNGTLVFGEGVRERDIEVRILNDGLREETEEFVVRLSNSPGGMVLSGEQERSVVIADNDLGIHVVEREVRVDENQAKVVVQVRRDDDGPEPATVRVATLDGTAVAGEDYEGTTAEFILARRGSVRAVEVPVLNDGKREGSEVFLVQVAVVYGGFVTEGLEETRVYVQDNDPGVWFESSRVYVGEGSGVASCRVRLQADVPGPVTVDFATVAETALAGQDYVATNGTLVFETGTGVREIVVPVLNDGVKEASETFRVRLSNLAGGVAFGEQSEVTVDIYDDDHGIRLSGSNHVSEDSRELSLWVGRDDDLPGSATVRVTTVDGTAVAGEDYEAVDQVITLEGRGAQQFIRVPVINDGLKEGEETFNVMLSEAQGSWIETGTESAVIRIQDNDPGVSVYEWSAAYEGMGLHFITVQRRDDLPVAVSVDYRTKDDTAVTGKDYVATNGTLVFQPGETSKQLAVPILNDAVFESERRFKVQLSGVEGGAWSGPDTVTVTIQDNDTVFFDGSGSTEEHLGSVRLLVRRGDPEGSLTVSLATEDETAQAGLDYVGTNVTVHFSPGETVKPVRVTILNDGLIEDYEWFRASLSDVKSGAELQYPSTVSAGIQDNDSLPGVETVVFNERMGMTNLVVLRGNDGMDREGLNYQVLGGTATHGVDYVLADGRLEFGSGVTRSAIPLSVLQDPDVEAVETVVLLLRSEVSGATNVVELKIEDEESPLLYDGSWRKSDMLLAWQVQPDGRVVVSYPLDEQSSQVMRLMPDGTEDGSFAPWLTNAWVNVLVLQSDGSVVCGGGSVCFRLTAGGLLDPAFQADTGGKLVARITALPGDRLAVALRDSADADRVTVERWEADGLRDSSFAGVELRVPPPGSNTGSGGWNSAIGELCLESYGDGLLVAGDINGVDGDGTPWAVLRLASDGTVDPAFQCSLGRSREDSVAYAVAVDDQGRIVVSGWKLDVDGEDWGSVIRLLANGWVDETFRCDLGDGVEVVSLALEPEGTVLAGVAMGWGSGGGSTGSQSEPGMVRLLADGKVQRGFTWSNWHRVAAGIRVNGDGTAFVAWGEWQYPRVTLQRVFLHPSTAVGAEFVEESYLDSYEVREGKEGFSRTVRRLGNTAGSLVMRCRSVDESAVAGSDYEGVDVVLEFGPGEVEKAVTVRLLDDGEVEGEESFWLVLEPLTEGAGLGLNFAGRKVILDNEVAPTLDRGYGETDAYYPIYAMAMQEDGRLVAVAQGKQVDYPYYAVVRFDPEGRLDKGFEPFAVWDSGSLLALQPGGRVVVSGMRRVADNDWRTVLTRLLPDGRPDPGFEVLEGMWVKGLAVDAQSRIWLVRHEDGEGRRLERLLPDGAKDPSFEPVPQGYNTGVMPVPLASGGAVLLLEGYRVMRLTDDGRVDEAFHSPLLLGGSSYSGSVQGLAEFPDGGILVRGDFTSVDGVPAMGLARLGANGVVDEAFTRAASVALAASGPGWISLPALVWAGVDHAGRVLVLFGDYSQVRESYRLVRLKADGSMDPGFRPVTVNAENPPRAVVDMADNVVLGGAFQISPDSGWTALARFYETTPETLVELAEVECLSGEGQATAQVRVVRRGDVAGSARVRWRTGAGTAVEGADYQAAGGVVIFAPLETEKSFQVPLLDDAIEEAEEWFAVTLFESEGAMLGGLERGRVWVTDDDLQGSIDPGADSPYAGWIAEPEAEVVGLAVQPGGGLLAWGNLEPVEYDGFRVLPGWALHRLNADGTRDAGFVAPAGFKELVGVRRDGRIVVTIEDALVRLGRDGGIEETLVDLGDWQVQRGALDGQDRIYLLVWEWGSSGPHLWLDRFFEDGRLDSAFQLHAIESGDSVGQVLPLQDGRVLLAGQFERREGQTRCLKVLTADGMPDESFVGGWFKDGSSVDAVTECPDGSLLVGGEFAVAEDWDRVSTVMRLDRFGAVDAGFGGGNAGLGEHQYGGISSLVRLWDGRIVVAGRFDLYDGVPCSGAVLLEANGRGAMALGGEGGAWFAKSSGISSGVIRSAAVMGDRLWLGGWFNRFAGHDQALLVGVVLTPALGFAESHITEDGLFRFGLGVQPGRTYVLEGSEDLRVWTPLSTNTAAADRLWFDDLDTPGNRRMFFRAVRR